MISDNLTKSSSNLALFWKDNHQPKAKLGLKLVIIITANCLFNEPFFLALEQFLSNPTFDVCNSQVCEVCKHIWSGNGMQSILATLNSLIQGLWLIITPFCLFGWMIYVFINYLCFSVSYAFCSTYLLSQLLLLAQDTCSTDLYRQEFSSWTYRRWNTIRIPPKLEDIFFPHNV